MGMALLIILTIIIEIETCERQLKEKRERKNVSVIKRFGEKVNVKFGLNFRIPVHFIFSI